MSVVDWVSIPSDEMTADGVPCALGMHMLKHRGRFGQIFHVPPPPFMCIHLYSTATHRDTFLMCSLQLSTPMFSVLASLLYVNPHGITCRNIAVMLLRLELRWMWMRYDTCLTFSLFQMDCHHLMLPLHPPSRPCLDELLLCSSIPLDMLLCCDFVTL